MNEQDGDGRGAETTEDSPASGPVYLADDAFYRALTNRTRRRLVYYLTMQSETTVEDSTTALVGWDVSGQGSMASPSDHKKIRTALEHVHLPMLADAGLIEYDPASGVVAANDLHEDIEWLLERSITTEPE